MKRKHIEYIVLGVLAVLIVFSGVQAYELATTSFNVHTTSASPDAPQAAPGGIQSGATPLAALPQQVGSC